jgi:hypothetical protein
MIQTLSGGYPQTPHTTSVTYSSLAPTWAFALTITGDARVIPCPGILSNWRIELTVAPGVGRSWRFQLYKNGIASTWDITITGAATSGDSGANQVDVVAGDYISVKCTPSGTPASTYFRFRSTFTGNNAGESLIMGGINTNRYVTRYGVMSTAMNVGITAEATCQQLIAAPGKLKNLYVWQHEKSGTGIMTWRHTVRVNGVSSPVTCDVVAAATTGNSGAAEVEVAAGDYVTLMSEPINSPNTNPYTATGVCFVPDTDGEALILGGSSGAFSNANPAMTQLSCGYYSQSWHDLGAWVWERVDAGGYKNLYVKLTVAPGAGKQRVFAIYVNGVQSALKCTVSVNDGDLVELGSVPSGSPAATALYWGVVTKGAGVPATCYGIHAGAMAEMLS